MPFEIVRNDITRMDVDVIVNAANESLLGGGGVDGAIHRAAGPGLLNECRLLNGCGTGEVKITRGYKLPAEYVIHTVGPIWQGGNHNEEELLKNCYRKSLQLAREYHAESIAFPLISAGVYGYPKEAAIHVACSVIRDFLNDNEMDIYLVIFDRTAFELSGKLQSSVSEYIDDNYVEDHGDDRRSRRLNVSLGSVGYLEAKRSLSDLLDNIDETFTEMLLRLIDQKGMTDVEAYKKANIDRKLFSKIRNNPEYNPSKHTAIAFAIALGLNLDETKDLLLRAGYALSHSNKADVIVEYFIGSHNYDIYEINMALFKHKQKTLGC